MAIFKKKDGDKKMTATLTRVTKDSKTGKVTKSAPKKMELKTISAKEFNSSAPKAKPSVKPKPLSNAGKYGLGAVARTVKGQGEMKTMMARPKTGTAAAPKVKPTREQKARAAGMVAAQRSRREGAAMSSMDRAVERGVQRGVNYLGQEFSDKGNRYNGLSDSQLSDKRKK